MKKIKKELKEVKSLAYENGLDEKEVEDLLKVPTETLFKNLKRMFKDIQQLRADCWEDEFLSWRFDIFPAGTIVLKFRYDNNSNWLYYTYWGMKKEI